MYHGAAGDGILLQALTDLVQVDDIILSVLWLIETLESCRISSASYRTHDPEHIYFDSKTD
jgi:hypothetical protein